MMVTFIALHILLSAIGIFYYEKLLERMELKLEIEMKIVLRQKYLLL